MMKHLPHVAVVACLFFVFSPFEDTHWPKWVMFYLVAAGTLGMAFGAKYHWSLGTLVASVIYSGAQAFANRNYYQSQHPIAQIDLSQHAAKATLAFMLLVVIADRLKQKSAESFIEAYVWVLVAHCHYVAWQEIVMGLPLGENNGFLPNISMGPSMLGMALPWVVWRALSTKSWVSIRYTMWAVLFVITMLHGSSAIGFAGALAGLATIFWCVGVQVFGWKRATLIPLAAVIIAIPVGRLFDPDWGHLNNQRFLFWPMLVDWWVANSSWLTGTGTGTFRHIGPHIQQLRDMDEGNWWLWAHNDWLQIIFETGVAGFLSALVLVAEAVRRAYRAMRYDLVAVLVAVVVVAFGNYPLRLAEFAFFVMVVMTAAIKLPKHSHS